MPTVYVVQEPLVRRGHDARPDHKYSLEPAKKYGELCVLMDWGKTKTPVNAEKLSDLMVDRLAAFTKDDYLLLAGNPGLIALATMVAAQYTDGYVNVLIWDRNKQEYDLWPLDVKLLPHKPDEERTIWDRSAE